jgi:hypothetical protein
VTVYIEPGEFAVRHGITTTTNLARIAEHAAAASRRIDAITGRTFGPHTGAATVRTFRPTNCHVTRIDDAYEITAVATDDSDDGTFSTTWSTTDYETEPANGIGVDAQSGWPVEQLGAVGNMRFPVYGTRRCVRVTAKWGWSAVPTDIVEATHLLTHRLYYEVAVPGGVTTPNPEFGIPGAPLMRPYTFEALVRPFIRLGVA